MVLNICRRSDIDFSIQKTKAKDKFPKNLHSDEFLYQRTYISRHYLGIGGMGWKKDLYSNSAGSPSFGCHFKSRKQMQNVAKNNAWRLAGQIPETKVRAQNLRPKYHVWVARLYQFKNPSKNRLATTVNIFAGRYLKLSTENSSLSLISVKIKAQIL